MLWMLIPLFGIIIDQLSKYAVMKRIGYGEIIPLIGNFLYLTYHENKGAAWSIFQNGRYFFIILTSIISLFLIYYILFRQSHKFLKLSLSFILAGALGNLIDRIVKGSVADFIGMNFWSYHFPIYNVADMLVVIGSVLLFIYLLFIYKEQEKGNHLC